MTGHRNIRTGLRALTAIVVLAAAFVLPAQAFAQQDCSNVGSDPTAAQYCSPSDINSSGNAGNSSGTSSPSNATASGSSAPSAAATSSSGESSGTLPFTGLDVFALLAVAAVLTGTGLVLRRLTASGGYKG